MITLFILAVIFVILAIAALITGFGTIFVFGDVIIAICIVYLIVSVICRKNDEKNKKDNKP